MKHHPDHDAHVADFLQHQAYGLEEAGRHDEAIAFYRRAALLGDISTNLPRLLTNREGVEWAEGMLWYRRMLRAGDGDAAWNLAMAYRQQGNRRRYLGWMRRAARMGVEDAITVLAEIERRQAARQSWPMFMSEEIDGSDALFFLTEFREGRVSASELSAWAGAAARGEAAVRLEKDPKGRLVAVLAEMAEPSPMSRQRALELYYKLTDGAG